MVCRTLNKLTVFIFEVWIRD